MDDKIGDILIVDDTPDNLAVLSAMLREHGYRVRPAISGQVALHAAGQQAPDLILLDVMMPGMNGYEVCERLKGDDGLRDVPVLFLSALNEVGDKVRALELGAVDYITKPFQVLEVLARVKTHLSLQSLRRQLERMNGELRRRNEELQAALADIKTLRGLIPICANCKKIRDDEGYWHRVEAYIGERSEATFTHGICPQCLAELYPEVAEKVSREDAVGIGVVA